jgi:hypothetical protein
MKLRETPRQERERLRVCPLHDVHLLPFDNRASHGTQIEAATRAPVEWPGEEEQAGAAGAGCCRRREFPLLVDWSWVERRSQWLDSSGACPGTPVALSDG